MKLKYLLSQEHKGIGGIYFLTTALICAVMTIFILNVSFVSQCVSMADNLAHIVSINTAVYSYERNMDSYSYTNANPQLLLADGTSYSPLTEFNTMLRSTKIAKTVCSGISISWDKDTKVCRVELSSFINQLGSEIVPHSQESHITQ